MSISGYTKTIIGRKNAVHRYQQKLDSIGLPKAEQEEFYQRYDSFQKRIYRTSNSFYNNKNNSKSFYDYRRDMIKNNEREQEKRSSSRMNDSTSVDEKNSTFTRLTNKFILTSSNSNPVLEKRSQRGKIDITYVAASMILEYGEARTKYGRKPWPSNLMD